MYLKIRKCIKFLLIIIVFIFFSCNSVFAQSNSDTTKSIIWLSGGLGYSSLGSMAGSLSSSRLKKNSLLSIRTTANTKAIDTSYKTKEYYDYALIYGIGTLGENLIASIGTGIAIVENSNLFVGLPLEGQVSLKLVGVFRIGLYMFMNINKEKNFSGVTLCLQICSYTSYE